MAEHKRLVREIGRRGRPLSIVLIGVLAATLGVVVGAKLQPPAPRTPTWLELQRHLHESHIQRLAIEVELLDSPACESRDGAAPILAHLVRWGVRAWDFPVIQRCLARTRDRAWVLGQLAALEPNARDLAVFHLNATPAPSPAPLEPIDRAGREAGRQALQRGNHPAALAHLRTWLAEQQGRPVPRHVGQHQDLVLAQLIVEALEARAEGGSR